jgi:hypothetical protein
VAQNALNLLGSLDLVFRAADLVCGTTMKSVTSMKADCGGLGAAELLVRQPYLPGKVLDSHSKGFAHKPFFVFVWTKPSFSNSPRHDSARQTTADRFELKCGLRKIGVVVPLLAGALLLEVGNRAADSEALAEATKFTVSIRKGKSGQVTLAFSAPVAVNTHIRAIPITVLSG